MRWFSPPFLWDLGRCWYEARRFEPSGRSGDNLSIGFFRGADLSGSLGGVSFLCGTPGKAISFLFCRSAFGLRCVFRHAPVPSAVPQAVRPLLFAGHSVLLVLLPHEQISTVSSGGLLTGGSAFGGADGQPPAISSSAPSSSLESPETAAEDGVYTMEGASGQVIGYLHGYDAEAKTVTIPDSEFYNWCSELFLYPDRFEGFEVTITGFVLKDIPSLNADEFVPARLMMSCCAADLSPCGIVCKYDGVAGLAADSWVTVTGVLQVGSFEGAPEPQLHVSSIEPAEEITDYVYPY